MLKDVKLKKSEGKIMKRYLVFLVVIFMALGVTIRANATPYFQITNGKGRGMINYYSTNPSTPPLFKFSLNQGSITYDMNFVPGRYDIDFTLEGLSIDANEDGTYSKVFTDTNIAHVNQLIDIYNNNYGTSIPYVTTNGSYGPLSWTIDTSNNALNLSYSSIYLNSLPPLNGTYGPLTWAIDNQGVNATYDFGDTGTFTNERVNQMLAIIDDQYSGQTNGVMDANIKWDKLRIELNRSPAPVPEPSTFLLLGAGLLGIALISRRQFKKA